MNQERGREEEPQANKAKPKPNAILSKPKGGDMHECNMMR
jgi:hypothetical protein